MPFAPKWISRELHMSWRKGTDQAAVSVRESVSSRPSDRKRLDRTGRPLFTVEMTTENHSKGGHLIKRVRIGLLFRGSRWVRLPPPSRETYDDQPIHSPGKSCRLTRCRIGSEKWPTTSRPTSHLELLAYVEWRRQVVCAVPAPGMNCRSTNAVGATRSSSRRNQDPLVTSYPRSVVEGSPWPMSRGAESDDHLTWHRTTVSGTRAVYGVGGADGPPVVFLHGWALGSRAYKRAIRRLTTRGCRVFAPALPSFGGTADLPCADMNLDGYADWVTSFMSRGRNQGARSRDRPFVWWWCRHQAGP